MCPEWHPILCRWHAYFDAWKWMDHAEGEAAAIKRTKGMMQQMGVETVQPDPFEHPMMLHIDNVCGIVYWQKGYFGLEERPDGKADFLWVDTMWDKM